MVGNMPSSFTADNRAGFCYAVGTVWQAMGMHATWIFCAHGGRLMIGRGALAIAVTVLAALCGWCGDAAGAGKKGDLNVLFIGNSFTFRNDLPTVVQALAVDGNPGMKFEFTKLVYGGRRLEQHWEQFRSQSLLRLPDVTKADLEKICEQLRAEQAEAKKKTGREAKDAGRYAGAIRNHKRWMEMLDNPPKYDYVVLQSWRDTEGGLESSYATYARKFAELIHKRGAKVVLYATAPQMQNKAALTTPPDPGPAMEEARFLAALGKELDALVVPVPLAINRCQHARPDITLRWKNDGHANQTCAYLTACTFYAVLFDRSPEGLSVSEVTDNKISDKQNPDNDPDGNPRRVVFPDDLRAFLQKTAWEAVQEYRKLADSVK